MITIISKSFTGDSLPLVAICRICPGGLGRLFSLFYLLSNFSRRPRPWENKLYK